MNLNMVALEHGTSLIGKLSTLFYVPEVALRLFISILLGFPLAFLYKNILYTKKLVYQHLFFIFSGLAIGYWNFGFNVLHSTGALCLTHILTKMCGNTAFSVLVTLIFNMTYLLWGYYVTSTRNYDITWTMPHCVLTLKLVGLAFNLWDGQKADAKLSDFQKKAALKTQPSFLETAAFVYFPGSFLIGPQYSIRRYLDFTNGQLMKRDSSNAINISDSTIPGLQRAVIGLFYMLLFQVGNRYVPSEYFLKTEYLENNFVQRFFLLGLWGRISLYKYISCWLITEGVCITFGLTYNGQDTENRTKWDGCANVDLLTFENATQFNHYILSFNINTNQWSAEYVYKRLKFLGSKLYSQLATLFFLALWHGLHSGYYLCFFMEFIIMYFEKDIGPVLAKNEKLQKALRSHRVLRVLVWIILKMYTFTFMGYSLVSFLFLSYSRYTQVYASVYYCGHVLFLSYPLFAPYLKKLLRDQTLSKHHEK